ncbi:type II CAAX endopeptidase family protein [Chengkuizengella sp. SCS-71B]|uniref:CPBP family intramembrane glutamic endopeptidase n=1 Tax=Chengkuizengella sp. SCS-71B TaxID=3115290 RepID=UPI0032C21D4C
MKKYLLMIANLAAYLGATYFVFELLVLYLYNNFEWFVTFFERNIPLYLIFITSVTFLLFLFIFYIKKIFLKENYKSIWSVCNFSMINRKQMFLFTLIGLAGTLWFISFMKITYFGERFPDLESYMEVFSRSDNFFYVFIGVGIVGVLFEEILFRGLVFNEFNKVMPFPIALILNAIVYGYFQPSPIIMFTGFMLGILYGLVYFKTKSIWSSIWIGIVLNVSMFTFRELKINDAIGKLPDWVLVLTMISSFLFILISVIYLFKSESLSNNNITPANKLELQG